jgi:hypothetical protein
MRSRGKGGKGEVVDFTTSSSTTSNIRESFSLEVRERSVFRLLKLAFFNMVTTIIIATTYTLT